MSACVYRHFNAKDELLYVGFSLSFLARQQGHKGSEWFSEIAKITVEYFDDEKTAMAAEFTAISNEKPKYNKQCFPPVISRSKLLTAKWIWEAKINEMAVLEQGRLYLETPIVLAERTLTYAEAIKEFPRLMEILFEQAKAAVVEREGEHKP